MVKNYCTSNNIIVLFRKVVLETFGVSIVKLRSCFRNLLLGFWVIV